MSGNTVGIEIGSGGVRAVEVRNGHTARPVVVRSHALPLAAGVVDRGEVLDIKTAAEAVTELWKTGGFRTKEVALGVGGTAVLSREISLPAMPLSRIREALPFHVEGILPIPVADTILDFYPVSEGVDDDGPVVHGLLIAAVKDAVSANVAAMTQGGLTVVRVDLVPFALTRAIAPRRSSTGTTVIVNVGATVTNVIVADAGVPQFVRILPTGGDDLMNEPVAAGWGLEEYALSGQGLPVAPTPLNDHRARARLDEFVSGIRATVEYFLNSKSARSIDRVALSGSGRRVARLDLALADAIGVDVEWSPAFPGARLARGVDAGADEADASMTTAYGLALGAAR